MNKNEMDTARLSELLPKLPAEVQERIGYIIQGALLVSGNRIAVGTKTVGAVERVKKPPGKTADVGGDEKMIPLILSIVALILCSIGLGMNIWTLAFTLKRLSWDKSTDNDKRVKSNGK